MTLNTQEFFDWIKAQPDERPVAMKESKASSPCGCLLVQFGKHKKLTFTSVGYRYIGYNNYFKETDLIRRYITSALAFRITTFKQAKELLPS